jgi:nucleotide-binding universal stress UspA family protein
MKTVILVADASEAAGAAAEWTGLRARITGPDVRILEFGDSSAGPSPADVARDRIRELAPGTPVSVERPQGHPVDVLCELADEDTLVVIGGAPAERRGKPASLPARLAGRIRCDLVVVPPGWHPDGGPVVAGWDDTPESAHALDRAAEEARLLGADLQIVHTYLPPTGSPYDPAGWAVLSSEVRRAAEGDLGRATARARHAHPDLTISRRLALGSPTGALLGAVASLIVVGTHHRNALSQVLLGTTDDNLARRVDEVPVLIVDHGPPARDAEQAGTTAAAATG